MLGKIEYQLAGGGRGASKQAATLKSVDEAAGIYIPDSKKRVTVYILIRNLH